ncbi:MAG: cupin domain-containing protein [Nitrososphaerales archaeon]
MYKSNAKDVTPDNSMSDYFVGKVELRKVIGEQASKEVELYLVEFKDGARTKLHYHEVDQILMASKGNGIVSIQSKVELSDDGKNVKTSFEQTQDMRDGDTVLVPAFKWHWHGAVSGEDFAHYQMKKVGKTTWLE